MFSFFLCFVIPTLVFGSNDTDITANGETLKLVLKNTTYGEEVITELQNTNISTQVPHNSTTMAIQTDSRPLQERNKTGQVMKSVPQEKQALNKKFKRPRAKRNMTNVRNPYIPIKKDLPDMLLKSDLEEILSYLHKMIDFFLENKNDVDISMYYGLFLLDVNLNKIFKYKRHAMPSAISFSLKHLLEKNHHLVTFFKKRVDNDFNPEDQFGKNMVFLFRNESLWMERILPYDGSHVNETVSMNYDELQSRYSDWDKYVHNVGDFDLAQPSPEHSDKCLGFLGQNPVHDTPWKILCQIPTGCRIPLERGTNFGYGLTHRLMYLQLAYYGHRCSVFSNSKDKAMREKFCKMLYAEASYISMNEYATIDLFVEQLCLCALDGHYEFLRRSWLIGILSFQTLSGCFADKAPEGATFQQQSIPHMWKLNRGEDQYVLGGQCNIHTSSAAAATLGFGVKFILQTFY